MKRIIVMALLALSALGAQAQVATGTVNSTTDTSSASTAANSGVKQDIAFNSTASDTLRTAPGLAMGSFSGSFSPDYCGGVAQGGLSLIGVGVTGGAPVFDKKCQGLRLYERTMQASASASDPASKAALGSVAVSVLCATYPDYKVIYQAQGLCMDSVNNPPKPVASANSGANPDDPFITARNAK